MGCLAPIRFFVSVVVVVVVVVVGGVVGVVIVVVVCFCRYLFCFFWGVYFFDNFCFFGGLGAPKQEA